MLGVVEHAQRIRQHIDGLRNAQHIFGGVRQMLELAHDVVAGVADEAAAEARQSRHCHKLIALHLGPQRVQHITLARPFEQVKLGLWNRDGLNTQALSGERVPRERIAAQHKRLLHAHAEERVARDTLAAFHALQQEARLCAAEL